MRDRGILVDDPSSDGGGFDDSESLLPFVHAASLQSNVALGAESGRPIPRLVDPAVAVGSVGANVAPPHEVCCELDGHSLHAATRVELE